MSPPKLPSRTTPSTVSANTIVTSLLTVQTSGAGFVDVTAEVAQFVKDARAREGAMTLFIRHTSASLTIQENADPSVLADLTTALARLAPENAGWTHDTEGPDAERRTRARDVAGDLLDRAPQPSAPARGRAAVHRRYALKNRPRIAPR